MLRFPVRTEYGKVVNSQYGIRVRKSLPRISLVILGANGQNYAPLFQKLYISLELRVCLCFRRFFSDPYTPNAIVANHSSPKCVVEVQDEALPGLTHQGFYYQIGRASCRERV